MVMVDQVADIIETFPKPNNESYLVQYDVALLGVTFIGDIFRSSINMYYDTKKPDEIAKKLPGTLALLQTLLNNLQHFFIFASPPPALVVKGPPVACSDEGHSSSSDTASISPSTKSSKSLKFWKSSKSLRSLSGSKSSLFAFRSKTAAASTVTPSEPVPELPMRVDLSKPKDKEEMVLSRYRPRQSAIYLPSDPLYPKFDVEMPMPSGEAAAVMASQDGGIQAGTLYALVNILTSNGCVAGSQFYKTFFIGFRLFSTSHQFLDELMRRYEQPLPLEEWNQAQQRVAEREALLIRTRVVKVVMDWLHVHWVPEEDGEVLSSMLQFVDIVANGGLFPQKTVDRLAQEVQKRANGDYVIPKHKQYRCLSLQCAPDCKVADFNFPENYSTGSVYEHLMKFNSPLGWQEFAKQITAHASELFQEIKPEDLVMYWRVKQESNKFRRPLQEAKRSNEALARFESGLCIWVPSTIVLLEERVSRANLIVFWLEVATICVDLRNFCSACAIHTGLMKSAVTRMKDTLMNVPIRNKIQFRKLEKLFKANPYFTALRSSIDVPTVPGLMFHFCPLSVEKAKTMTLEADPEEGHENYTLINLGRYHWMEQIIQDLNSCLPHLLPKNVIFQAWFLDQLQPFELVIANDQQKIVEKSDFHLNQEEDRLHKISGVIEPPESIRFSNMPYDVWECIIGKGGEPEPFVIADDDSPPDSGKGEPTSDAQSAKTAHF
ncbi:ras guanine nucleotide exchange factor domain-containing protein [Cyathus striatus]|nr:ras guanine nucleotide exchange factor domain-containing protein [Cyathus striatus]